ncbi:MAG: dTMP kinase [archaeon]|nr:dTMP kinase [archaeon]
MGAGNKFIVFEGPHGSGKTTQARLLTKYFKSRNCTAIYTREPYSKDIKKMVDKFSSDAGSSNLLLYLHAADRLMHTGFIEDKLVEGAIVICDRYVLSSCVYQQIQGIGLETIERTNAFSIEPDMTYILDVPLSERKRRLYRSKRKRDTLFLKDDSLVSEEKIYKSLLKRYKGKGQNVCLIDASGDKFAVHRNIVDALC